MTDDLRMRKLSEKTQSHYIRAVVNFTRPLGRLSGTATAEDLRRYQLQLIETGISGGAITAVRFSLPLRSHGTARPVPAALSDRNTLRHSFV
jgi:hypothetical protein